MIVKVLLKAAQKRKTFNKLKAKKKSGKLLTEYESILKQKPKNAKAPIFLKHQKRRELLKKKENIGIMAARAFKKATPLGKAGYIAAVVAPKATLVGAGYLAGKNKERKGDKK
jgi:gentisate 1,2-dioxygenase